MTTVQLLSRLRDLEVRVWAEEDRLCFHAPQGAMTPDLRSALSERKAEILSFLRQGVAAEGVAGPVPGPAPESAAAPLSFAQRRLWFLAKLEPESSAYSITRAARLKGPVRVEVLARSLAEVVRRHAILRTAFGAVEGETFQIASPAVMPELPLIDLTSLPEADRETEAGRVAAAEAGRPFDLGRGPLLRVLVLRLAENEHILPASLHHIAADAWSTAILFRELGVLYEAFSRGLPSPLPALPLQYADYARWQRQQLDGPILDAQLAWWREQLADAPPALDLPTDRPRTAQVSPRGTAHVAMLPASVTERIHALGQVEGGTTSFMVLLAAFGTLLARCSGQDDLVVGLPVANRNRTALEGLIGLFVDTLALRLRLGGSPSFRELLGRVRQATLGAFAHQDLPFERLVETLRPERRLHQMPLFRVMLSLQNVPRSEMPLRAFRMSLLPPTNPAAQLDLSCEMEEGEDGLLVSWRYKQDLFDAATIARLADRFGLLLAAALAEPDTRIGELPLLAPSEWHQILAEWNGSGIAAAAPPGLHERVAAQAAARPDSVAIADGDLALTYGELGTRARRLASSLRQRGVGPESRVGICLDRSAATIVSLLAVLQAGGAYVPLDPAYPAERLDFMAKDADLRTIITKRELLGCLPPLDRPPVLLEEAWDVPADDGILPAPIPEGLAYIIYTSGSTGRPKGVGISHAAASRLFTATAHWFGFGPEDVWTLFHSFAFDFSVWEIWGALLHGGRLVLVPDEARRAPEELLGLLVDERVTVLNQTPSSFRQLVEVEGGRPVGLLALRWVVFGGEALDFHALAPWMARHGDRRPGLINMYGITETTVHVTFRPVRKTDLPPDGAAPSLLGVPIPDLQVHLLDRGREAVPVGGPGEIWVGGAGLARGYLARPDLTAERFRPHPWSVVPGARLYRSGDLARRRPDGDLEYLGRTDHQVKVRGFRIELGEIESVLAAFPGVRQAVALVWEEEAGDRRLIAYLVPAAGVALDLQAVRRYLEERLPAPSVPSALVPLDALPSTPSGKVDRAALARSGPVPWSGPVAATHGRRGPVEEAVAGIWSELLGLSDVGSGDDFFQIGGHSLLATSVLTRVRRSFGVELPVAALFEDPTLARFAARIDRELRSGDAAAVETAPLVPRPRTGDLPLSFAQRRLWFLDRLAPGNPFYNVPIALRLAGRLHLEALAASLAAIVQRHEVLRTRFTERDGTPLQLVAPRLEARLPLADLSGLPAALRETEAARLAAEEARQPFDLATGPLFRFALLRIAPEDHRLFLTLHHIVTDAWSMGVLRRELAVLYSDLVAGRLPRLSPLPVQHADFAVWQHDWYDQGGMARQLAWWQERLAGAPEEPGLPFDHSRPPTERFRGGAVPLAIPAETAAAVRSLARREGLTTFMVLLGAFEALLARWTGETDTVLGTPIANRGCAEIEGLIGFFANTLVLRTGLAGDPGGLELLDRARQTALAAYTHQDLPFEVLVEAMAPERHLSRNPLFQVLLVHQRLEEDGPDLPGVTIGGGPEGMAAGTGTAKFDLTLSVAERPDGLLGAMEYDADLFEAPTAARLASAFESLLGALVTEPGLRLGDLPLLSAAERQQVTIEWNDSEDREALAAAELPVYAGFLAWTGRTPEAPAVIWEGSVLTYGDLGRLSGRLAARLRELGAGPGSQVGLCVERSFAMAVGVLGILRAGATYVPLDPDHPRDRLGFMLEDLERAQPAPVVVTHEWLIDRLPAGSARSLFLSESGASEDDDLPDELPEGEPVRVAPEDLAYVIYTSGSTGRPKGVALAHRALSNLVAWHLRTLVSGVRTLGFASLSFDASFHEMFLAWSSGGALVLATEEERHDPPALARLLAAAQVEKAILPVVVLQELAELWGPGDGPPPELREIITTGERLQITPSIASLFALRGAGLRLYNHYGPSETHVATAWPLAADPASWETLPPIGRPIANARIHLLDAWGRPVPVGAAGDLHLGGVCLARGYLGRPDLTAERFVPDPFAPPPGGGRLYRTGDRSRLRPAGAVEYLGRFDDQLKIRGFRVEPGEIEAALLRHPEVREAVVLLREGKLIAWVVGPPTLDPHALAVFLRESLPDPMVPAAYAVLPALPLTRNGKVDRRALATPGMPAAEKRRFPPHTPAEEVVVAAWGEVLGLDPALISVHDDFFLLGGHSLLATRVASRLRASFGVEVPVRLIFEARDAESLARRVEELSREWHGMALPPIRPVPRSGPVLEAPLSFAQEWMWFVDRLDPGGSTFLSPLPVRLRGPLDVPALRRSVEEVVRRHEMLRTTFPVVDGQPVQRVAPALRLEMPMADLSGLEDREAEAARLLAAELRIPLDLERGPLIRLLLLRLGPEEHHLLVTAHHILFDGWSNGLLLAEVAALYDAFAVQGGGEPSPLPPLPIQYADFAVWQREQLGSETLERLLGYWRERLAGDLPVLALPGARPGIEVATMRSARCEVELGPELSAAAQALAHARGTTLFAVLLAALQTLLHRLTRQDDILVGTPVAGRNRSEVEKLIGYFVNTLVMRGDLRGDPPFDAYLAQVWETALGAYAHQDLPFTRLVAELRPDRAASRTPIFQVLFLLQNTPMPSAALPGLAMDAVGAEVPIATFDLSLNLKETPDGVLGWFYYNRDLFEPSAMEALAGRYRLLLEGIVAAPDRRVSELPLLTDAERQQLTARPTAPAAEEEVPLHRRFAERVEEDPEGIALVADGEETTYGDLARGAWRLAARLRHSGVGPGAPVAICLERSRAAVEAVLAVLAAGAVSLPLDPDSPPDLLHFALEDSGAKLVIARKETLPVLEGIRIVDPDQEAAEEEGAVPPPLGQEGGAAHILYAKAPEGGFQKSVITHADVSRLLAAAAPLFHFDERDAWTLAHPPASGLAIWETWGALLHGSRLVLAEPMNGSPAPFLDRVRQERVTVLTLAPSELPALVNHAGTPAAIKSLRWLVVSGGASDSEALDLWLERYGDRKPRLALVSGLDEGDPDVQAVRRP